MRLFEPRASIAVAPRLAGDRILFVDPDGGAVAALEAAARAQGRDWELSVMTTAEAASVELERVPYQVVVADLGRPGDGAALLERVRREHPEVARILLSRHAEDEALVRALPVAHQFLRKPYDATVLAAVIHRTCQLHRILANEKLRAIVGKLDKLPSSPKTYWELNRAATDERSTMRDFAQIIERDPAISTKVLQLANSAYFGLPEPVTSIPLAVAYLGVRQIRALALSAQVFSVADSDISIERHQERSILTARVGQRLVTDPELGEEIFTSALVHDIGRIIIGIGVPTEFAAIAKRIRETGSPVYVAEREILGVTHAELGAFLMGMWGLPLSIVEATAYHHSPREYAGDSHLVLAALHAASALVDRALVGDDCDDLDVDRGFLDDLGLGDRLESWAKIVREEMRALAG